MRKELEEHKEQLGTFFAGLAPVVEVAIEAQKRLDCLVATRFSVFQYFREDENQISGILADLLRPDGSHGQGATFLRLFLKEIDHGRDIEGDQMKGIRKIEDYGELEPCSVWTEYSASQNRRIDIVLKIGSGNQWIGIENKPWAGEQHDQLQHYLDFLQKRKQDDRACILYLSGSGDSSETIQEASADHYLTIPYGYTVNGPSVAHWIAECHEHCQADKVRWFLKDLQEYIQRMFYSESSAEEYYDG